MWIPEEFVDNDLFEMIRTREATRCAQGAGKNPTSFGEILGESDIFSQNFREIQMISRTSKKHICLGWVSKDSKSKQHYSPEYSHAKPRNGLRDDVPFWEIEILGIDVNFWGLPEAISQKWKTVVGNGFPTSHGSTKLTRNSQIRFAMATPQKISFRLQFRRKTFIQFSKQSY